MDAAEARLIEARAAAKRAVIEYLAAVSKVAKDGDYECQFGRVSDGEALTLLGFRVIPDGPNHRSDIQ